MIENAWNEYRGWAKRAREMQEYSQRWTRLAMATAVLAAIFSALAGQSHALAWFAPAWLGEGGLTRSLAFLAAACAAVTPVLGQDILSVGREAQWIRARATAEAMKSECFRFAARDGGYAGDDRAAQFRARRDAAIDAATRSGLAPLSDPSIDDKRCPAESMAVDWYEKNRLLEQRDYYAKRQVENERSARQLRNLALAIAIAAALLGAAIASFLEYAPIAPAVGVLVTLGAIVVAQGLVERRQYLAASYGAMAGALGRVQETYADGAGLDLAGLVSATEDLLSGEHAAWSERMLKTIAPPPTARAEQK